MASKSTTNEKIVYNVMSVRLKAGEVNDALREIIMENINISISSDGSVDLGLDEYGDYLHDAVHEVLEKHRLPCAGFEINILDNGDFFVEIVG